MDIPFKEILMWLIGGGIGLGALAGGIGFLWSKIGKGPREEKNEMITAAETVQKFWKDQAENYKVMMDEKDKSHAAEIREITTDFHNKFNNLSKDFGVLQGQYNAEKEAREKAEQILKDRNPETIKFMSETVEVLGEIRQFMEKINTHMEQDLKIESTVTHQ